MLLIITFWDVIINTVSKIAENVKSEDLSDDKLVKIVAKNLGVPEDANVTY